jgi:hypothetical protein
MQASDVLVDRNGVEIAEGAILLDDRGRVFRALVTEGTYRRSQFVKCREVRVRVRMRPMRLAEGAVVDLIRAYDTFVVAEGDVLTVAASGARDLKAWFDEMDRDSVRRRDERAQVREHRAYANYTLENAGLRG